MSKICSDKKGDDKKLHILMSFVIGVVFAGLFSMTHFPWSIWSSVATFGAVMLVGIAKEVYDMRKVGNHFCVWDLLADAAGGAIASVLAYYVNYYTWNIG